MFRVVSCIKSLNGRGATKHEPFAKIIWWQNSNSTQTAQPRRKLPKGFQEMDEPADPTNHNEI